MSNGKLIEHLDLAGDFIRLRLGDRPVPQLGIVLGSGLGPVADQVKDPVIIPYTDVPYFPESTVTGHAGRLLIGELEGTPVVCLQGRFHLYEGYAAHQVVFPLRALGRMGVKAFVLTNAAGGVNESFSPGDLMVITDHLNLSGTNPMIGSHSDELGPRFPDMGNAYDPEFQAATHAVAKELGLSLQQGVYTVLSGPSYETPAEVRMLRLLGGDAVGMSTVPEVIALRQMGLRILGISLISNLAAGLSKTPLSHKEVIETAERVKNDFVRLIQQVVPKLQAAL